MRLSVPHREGNPAGCGDKLGWRRYGAGVGAHGTGYRLEWKAGPALPGAV